MTRGRVLAKLCRNDFGGLRPYIRALAIALPCIRKLADVVFFLPFCLAFRVREKTGGAQCAACCCVRLGRLFVVDIAGIDDVDIGEQSESVLIALPFHLA